MVTFLLMQCGCLALFESLLPSPPEQDMGNEQDNPSGNLDAMLQQSPLEPWPADTDPQGKTPGMPEPEGPLTSEGLSFQSMPEAAEAQEPRRPSTSTPPSSGYSTLFTAPELETPIPIGPPQTGRMEPSPSTESAVAPEEAPIAWQVAAAWRQFYDEGPQTALLPFLELVSEAPHRSDVHLGLGLCLLAREELDAAYEQFELAYDLASGLANQSMASLGLASDSEQALPLFYLGAVAYQRGHFREAVSRWEALQPLLDRMPTAPLHRDQAWLLGRAWLELGDPQKGEHHFRRALAQGGQGEGGRLNPPDPALERTVEGLLPGGTFMPVGGRRAFGLDAGLVFAAEGALWTMKGDSWLRERVTWPPPGWYDGFPVPEPGGKRLLFLSRDPQGRHFLTLQEADGQRQQLLDRPIAPVLPAWSSDRSLVAFVALEGEPVMPRLFLFRLSTRDVTPVALTGTAIMDPTFTPLNHLILSLEEAGAFRLFEWSPGASSAVPLPVYPLERTAAEVRAEQEAARRPATPVLGPSMARATERRRPLAAPMKVQEPWIGEKSAELAAPKAASEAAQTLETPDTGTTSRETPPKAPTKAKSSSQPPASGVVEAAGQDDGTVGHHGDARQPVYVREGKRVYTGQSGALRRILLQVDARQVERPISPATLDCHSPAVQPGGRALAFVCRDGTQQWLYGVRFYDDSSADSDGSSTPAGGNVRIERLFDQPLLDAGVNLGGPAWWRP